MLNANKLAEVIDELVQHLMDSDLLPPKLGQKIQSAVGGKPVKRARKVDLATDTPPSNNP